MLFERENAAFDANAVKRIADETGIDPRTAEVLVSRGLDTPAVAAAFLSDGKLYDPFLLDGMAEACDIIEDALQEGQPITIFGDYDCDGVCAAALLHEMFAALGAEAVCELPSRALDGYGLNEDIVRRIAKRGGLLITVDCGITNIGEVTLAKELGMTVIVTDHHRPLEQLPPADAIIDAHVAPSSYPFPDLCGAGVAFKIMQAFLEEDAMEYIDICALATVADIVPLLDENRTIVKAGLRKINSQPRPGIDALVHAASMGGKEINAGRIAFTLAPRVNSAGRMGDAHRALRLLTASDEAEATTLAQELSAENTRRQSIEEEIIQGVQAQAAEQAPDRLTLVTWGRDWHSGVIGIVASRMVERYNRPCIVISIDDEGIATGSARGIAGMHIFRALDRCADILIRYGGHEMAGGFSLKQTDVEAFAERFETYCRENYPADTWLKKVYYDLDLAPADVTLQLARDLDQLAPFGCGNATPTALLKGVKAEQVAAMGKSGEHQRITFAREGQNCEAVSFGRGMDYIRVGGIYDIIASISVNEWNGVSRAQCIVKEQRTAREGFWHYPEHNRAGFAVAFLHNLMQPQPEGLVEIQSGNMVSYCCDKLEECPFGRVVLVNTPAGARKLFDALNERGRLEGTNIALGSFDKPESLENAIVLAPDTKLDFSGYTDIIYVDKPYTQAAGGSCFVPSNDAFGLHFAKALCMDRDAMAKAYRALAALKGRRYVSFNGFCSAVAKMAGQKAECLAAAYCVFRELGFMDFSRNMLTVNAAQKRDLGESRLYTRLVSVAGR